MQRLNLWGEPEEVPIPLPAPLLTAQQRNELARERATQRKEAGNPLIAQYGPGPEGRMCRECVHFLRVHYHDKNYMKCDLRKLTHGAGSDHRSRWPTCGHFVEGQCDGQSVEVRK